MTSPPPARHTLRAGPSYGRSSLRSVIIGGRSSRVQAPDLNDLDTERLQPGEQSLQSRLILQRAVHNRLDRLDRGGEPFEVEQGLRRENTGYPDLVIGRRHR